jgi:DNA-binding NarL/FixJ family response regulator
VIRVLIADDETLMRTGIELILSHAPDIEVVAQAPDGPAAVRACREQDVDVALLDIRMPDGDGIAATAEIARLSPRTSIVMLTTFGEDRYVAEAMRAGATGFLLKDTGPADLVQAVRTAARGESVLAPPITRRLIEQHLVTGAADEDARKRVRELTPAERDVLRLVGTGASNAEIAAELYIAVSTVKAHLSRLLARLGCTNRVQAAIVAHEAGLLT